VNTREKAGGRNALATRALVTPDKGFDGGGGESKKKKGGFVLNLSVATFEGTIWKKGLSSGGRKNSHGEEGGGDKSKFECSIVGALLLKAQGCSRMKINTVIRVVVC